MDYLHSPSKYHHHNNNNLASKSPISLFDSPSISSNRFSDQYPTLSCESPPANFDHLQTPMRRTLDWGTELMDKSSSPIVKSTIQKTSSDQYKRTPERPISNKTPSPFVTTTTTPETNKTSLYQSPMKNSPTRNRFSDQYPALSHESPPGNLHNFQTPMGHTGELLDDSPLITTKSTLQMTTTLDQYQRTPEKSTKTPSPPERPPANKTITTLDRIGLYRSPLKSSPINNYDPAATITTTTTTRKTTSSPPQVENTSPITHQGTMMNKYKNTPMEPIRSPQQDHRRPLEYISSPIRNTMPYDTTSPREPTYSIPSKPKTPLTKDHSSPERPKDAASPPQDPVIYRSPVYSNSSYKPTVKRSTSLLDTVKLDARQHLTLASQEKHSLPHYMRATESYQSRIQAQVDHQHHAKLHKTTSGGVVKRARSPQVFRSSTKINAIDDIKNEMTPEDVYIPLAARVKLFEKGLGNGGHSTLRSTNDDHTTWTHRLTKAKSPFLLTRERSLHSSHHRHEFPEDQPGSLTDRLLQETRRADSQDLPDKRLTKRKRQTSEDRPVKRSHREAKPFRFATDERAARYQEAFRAKLNHWKEKDLKDNN
ncbi:hypothetical protein BC941DRAFT_499192 [Chlamydoabsidia padenii]|nr:hypothetical protein BC941DRAFT_499192 [Chlamydoabsidia padenii]